MARALDGQQVTPADELRDLLTISERQVSNLSGAAAAGGAGALDLLRNLDRVAELWPQLEAAGVDLRPEAGRWETVQAMVRRRAAPLLSELRPLGGLPALRAKAHPGGDAPWWWNLAEEMRRRALRRGLIFAAVALGLVLVVALAGFAGSKLFPVDPVLREAFTRMNAGQQKIMEAADYAAALPDFEAAVALTPADSEPWLWLGATRQQVGDDAGARQAFEQAKGLVKSDLEFDLLRSTVYIGMQDLARAQADIDAALAIDPENPEAYYYQATIYEIQGRLREATVALQRSSELAEARKQTELTAMARSRMAMLLLQAQSQVVLPETPTPGP